MSGHHDAIRCVANTLHIWIIDITWVIYINRSYVNLLLAIYRFQLIDRSIDRVLSIYLWVTRNLSHNIHDPVLLFVIQLLSYCLLHTIHFCHYWGLIQYTRDVTITLGHHFNVPPPIINNIFTYHRIKRSRQVLGLHTLNQSICEILQNHLISVIWLVRFRWVRVVEQLVFRVFCIHDFYFWTK